MHWAECTGSARKLSTPLVTEIFTAPRRTDQAIQRGAGTDPSLPYPHYDSFSHSLLSLQSYTGLLTLSKTGQDLQPFLVENWTLAL